MKKTTYFFSLLLLAFTFVQPSYAHRYFDSWRAQWCTPDPYLMLYPAWSPYNYGLCNPLRNIDPSGDTTYAYDQNHNLVPIDNSPDMIVWGQQNSNYVSGNFTILTLAQYTVIDPFMGHFHHMQPNREIVPTANGARWFAPRPTLTMGIVNIPGGPAGEEEVLAKSLEYAMKEAKLAHILQDEHMLQPLIERLGGNENFLESVIRVCPRGQSFTWDFCSNKRH